MNCFQTVRQAPGQIFKAYSFSLNTSQESEKALIAACAPHNGKAPDAVFACAGSSKPMYFIDMTEEDLTAGMANGYWLQAWTAHVRVTQLLKIRLFAKSA